MRTEGTFTVISFAPAAVEPSLEIVTATPTGVATMEKAFEGGIAGRSATLFTSAYDQERGAGTYVALESFEGRLGEFGGTFNFVHSATTAGADRSDEYFLIVPGSGTGELVGVTGTGGIEIDAEGVHRIWFDYEIAGEIAGSQGPDVTAGPGR
ncbi:hypothetical protein Caci_5573 [Catenulispora acidiphila DSM 44928]|uniref:DUF3224 domain-containing protein n=1 Tax=Catenulispora acidiphila (strain DSM 44928 / JCM 14897 / NBRC 102108 / NRRL B-24433 / ID139908) TaxID=479433 RepID=C7QAV9_CATAD|nr:DUF3224 domain-containing protein [Catenulispora acidiphila]ACU74432.1 hypothetical protein Caci_5573 [Catenulispora acidiphila DSM 44928]